MSPNNWDSQIIFENNTEWGGKKKDSIYVSSLQPCQIAYSGMKHWIVKKEYVFSFSPFRFKASDWTSETITAPTNFTPSS